MMNNVFYFIINVLFVLKVFKICSDFFGHVGKRFDEKPKVNFKIYDFTNWEANNHNNHDILKNKSNQEIKFGQLIEYNMGKRFLQKSCRK